MSYCAIIVVGFRCADDIATCLSSVDAIRSPEFAVHVCENGGEASYAELVAAISEIADPDPVDSRAIGEVVETRGFRLRGSGAPVRLHRATGNIGYAGAINATLGVLRSDPDWNAIWVLNPDTTVEPETLAALKRRADTGGYGIVGSRIVLTHNGRIQMYGGRWRRWMARGFNIGLGQPADAIPDVAAVEAAMDYVCGASMYVVRPFIEQVGDMEEGYFLYAEEVDWCFRRGAFRLGYAHDSIVHHSHGATIGSNHDRKSRSSFSVYLDERSKLLFTRRFFPGIFPLVLVSTLLLTLQYAKQGAYKNFVVALSGWLAGVRGEIGFPRRFLS